jgi:hypothetical protein
LERVGCVQPTAAQSGCTGQCPVVHRTVSGGAPNSVRCARLALPNWPLSRIRWRRTTIIHKTVRWCTGLFGEPTAASATVGRAIRARRVAPANDRLEAPDSVRCANDYNSATVGCAILGRRFCNSGCPVVHRTVWCATRQKARIAFQECLQRLLAALGL